MQYLLALQMELFDYKLSINLGVVSLFYRIYLVRLFICLFKIVLCIFKNK